MCTTNFFNHIALRKAKIVFNFGISECNRVKLVLSSILCTFIFYSAIDIISGLLSGAQSLQNIKRTDKDAKGKNVKLKFEGKVYLAYFSYTESLM